MALAISATLTSYLKSAAWSPKNPNKFVLAVPAAEDLYTYCFAQWCAQREAKSKNGKYIDDSTKECGGGAAQARLSAEKLHAVLKPKEKN